MSLGRQKKVYTGYIRCTLKKEIIRLNLDLLSIMFSLKNRFSSTYTNQLFCVVQNSNYIFV